MDEEKIVDLLWRLGIGPRLAGQKYLVRAVQMARSGRDITPELFAEIGESFGVKRSTVYQDVKKAQQRANGYRYRQYAELMSGYGDTAYDFVYALSRQV